MREEGHWGGGGSQQPSTPIQTAKVPKCAVETVTRGRLSRWGSVILTRWRSGRRGTRQSVSSRDLSRRKWPGTALK